MRKIKLLAFVPLFLFVFKTSLSAQNEIDKDLSFLDSNTQSSYFKIGADYISNNVYFGRKDSSNIPYLVPLIGYYNKTGLFIEGSLSLIPKNNIRTDLFTIGGGYDFHSRNQKFTGEIYAAKYFFNDSSKSVKSETKGEVDGIAAYDFGPLSINGSVNVLFTNPADLIFTAGLSHAFLFGNSYEWSVTPTASTNIGSLNFYKNYVIKRKLKKRNGRTVKISGINNFSALDYEFSLPVSYDIKHWSFLISPFYTIPVNPIQYYVNGIFYKQETLSNSFYMEASLAFKF